MITTTPEEFLEAYGDGTRFLANFPSTLRTALLVSPRGFRVSEESAQDNLYMAKGAPVDLEKADAQHQRLIAMLESLGVPVLLFPGQGGQDDGVFPNNVFATIPGRLIVGSMRHPVRRQEAERQDIRSFFRETIIFPKISTAAFFLSALKHLK